MWNRKQPVVDVIIPVYKPKEKLKKLFIKLLNQSYPVRKILVMNTDRRYWDPEEYREIFENNGKPVLEVHHVEKEEFDHGGTRNLGASYSDADILVFMTDDAVPADRFLIERLIEAFSFEGPKGELTAEVYAQQLADSACGPVERYTRSFNYPDQDRIKTKADIPELGIKTFFASNACCAYDREIFTEQGGFITKTIFNEDMIYAARTISNGYAVVYASGAKVVHSHMYTCMQQLHRNFDLAVSQADHPEIFSGIRSESEGIRLVKKTAAYLAEQRKLYLIPHLVMQSGFKYLGYFLGKRYRRLPHRLTVWCSMNREYWKGGRGHK